MSSQTVDDAVAVQRVVEEASAIDHQETVVVNHAMRHDFSHESVSKFEKKKIKLNQPQSHNFIKFIL